MNLLNLVNHVQCTCYYDDILETYFEDEKRLIPCMKRNPGLAYREELLDFIKDLCHRCNLDKLTLHLAVYVLDCFMDNFYVSENPNHRHLMATVVTFLAAKSEDVDQSVPALKDMMEFLDLTGIINQSDVISYHESPDPTKQRKAKEELRRFSDFYIKLEYTVFETMKHNMIRPTVASFTEIYSLLVICPDDYESCKDKFDSFARMQSEATHLMNEFLDCLLYKTEFASIPPSQMAAAVLAAVRSSLNVEPHWNERLRKKTKYQYCDIIGVTINLMEWRLRWLTIKREMHESGYSSDLDVSDPESQGSGESLCGSQPHVKSYQIAKRIRLN